MATELKGYKNEVNENRNEISRLRQREKEYKKRMNKEEMGNSTSMSKYKKVAKFIFFQVNAPNVFN